mgnify:CR=1 FL=1
MDVDTIRFVVTDHNNNDTNYDFDLPAGVNGSDGAGITAVNQPTPTTINFSLSDGTTTSNVT